MRNYKRHREQNEAIRLVQTLFGQDWRTYNATLAKALGSVNAAILYQQCCYWTTKLSNARKGWFYKTIAEFQEELGLSRYEQETAIKILLKHNLIEKKRGYRAIRYFRITYGILAFAKKTGMLENHKPNCHKPSARNAENKQFLYRDYAKTTQRTTNNEK